MRHNSERVPGKNYRQLGDRPLFCHIVDSLLQCRSVARIVVDTDSDQIREVSLHRYGDQVSVVSRPVGLRSGDTSMNDVLVNTTLALNDRHYIQVHSTTPFVAPRTIDAAVAAYFASNEHDALFGVTRIQQRLYWADSTPINHDPARLRRTQDLDPIFADNSCFYIFSHETLHRTGSRLGSMPAMLEVSGFEALDIDEEADFALAEAVWRVSSK